MPKSTVAINLQGIGKRYSIGTRTQRYETLRDTVVAGARDVARRLIRPHVGGSVADFWALRDLSFDIQKGEIVGVIGANGAGKSTLLKILSRITQPTEGRAVINGRVGSLLEVGTGFHPELSGRENIFLNGAIIGMKRAEIQRKFDEIVDFAGIELFLDTPVKRYSSGMFVRLAFSVAAFLEPEILMVDEVLAVGDIAFQKKCLGRMDEVASEGRTVVFVSHNMVSVRSLCQRAVLLSKGSVQVDADVDQVVNIYTNPDGFSSSSRTWENDGPGNEEFQLTAVRLKDDSGLEVSSFGISEDAVVEVEHQVLKDGTHVGFSLVMFDSQGACLFGSLNNKEPSFYGKPLVPGHYVSRCRINGNLLNSGRFSVSIIGFSANWSDGFTVDNVLSFETIDDGSLRGDYFQGYGGPFRPKFEWETASLGVIDK